MASRYFNQFPGSFRFGLKYVEGVFQVGASGAVVANSFTGGGISASSNVTVLKTAGTGMYQLQLNDNYSRLVGAHFTFISPTSGGTVPAPTYDGNLVVGQPYQIMGGTSANPQATQPTTSTNWYALGLDPGVNPAIGQSFVATSGGSNVPASSTSIVGQGRAVRILNSGLNGIELMPGINTQLYATSATSGVQGASILFQTVGTLSTSAVATPVNPNNGTWIRWNLWLDNSSRLLYNESSTSN